MGGGVTRMWNGKPAPGCTPRTCEVRRLCVRSFMAEFPVPVGRTSGGVELLVIGFGLGASGGGGVGKPEVGEGRDRV